jgi:hypothetical protein
MQRPLDITECHFVSYLQSYFKCELKVDTILIHRVIIAPARDILTYEDTAFTLEDSVREGSLYTGKPSEQLDKAWHDLLNGKTAQHVNISRHYLILIDENILLEPEYIEHYKRLDTTVEVPEGGRYIGTLNVFHELHCLKRIHQFMYSDYYFPDISEHQRDFNRLHNGTSQ